MNKKEKLINELRKNYDEVSEITVDGISYLSLERENYHFLINTEELLQKVEL